MQLPLKLINRIEQGETSQQHFGSTSHYTTQIMSINISSKTNIKKVDSCNGSVWLFASVFDPLQSLVMDAVPVIQFKRLWSLPLLTILLYTKLYSSREINLNASLFWFFLKYFAGHVTDIFIYFVLFIFKFLLCCSAQIVLDFKSFFFLFILFI